MLIVEDPASLPDDLRHPLLAIGVFDGVHLGHQEIIRRLTSRAASRRGEGLLLTFSPHPQKLISPADAPLLLQTRYQKQKLLEEMGVDILIRLPFTRRLSLLSPEQFVRRVLCRRSLHEIFVGSNFRFGHRRSGGFPQLRALGSQYGFQVCPVDAVCVSGQRVSSTRIRQALLRGRTSLARRYLGRPYQIEGTVVRGSGVGRKLGFPTANLRPENELIPARGVYLTMARLRDRLRPSVTNIGYRPTFRSRAGGGLTVETHFLEGGADVYGRRLSLDFYRRLRDEKQFPDPEALRHQIARDLVRARVYFSKTRILSRSPA